MKFIPVETAKDTVQTTVEKSTDTSWILHHVLDGNYLDFGFFKIPLPHIEIFGLDVSITRHVLLMWIAAILLILIFRSVSKAYKKNRVPKGVANLMEVLIVFVRDDIVKPSIGKGYEKFMPYLLTRILFYSYL
jgi:F-type H+-transporting ATPase subunit a